MKARLIKDVNGDLKLLYQDGSFSNASLPLIANLILKFKSLEDFAGKDGRWRDSAADMALYPGETIAIVTDTLELVIYSGEIFSECFDASLHIDEYISTEEYAKLHNKSKEIIKVFCRKGRIRAQKMGGVWMIPKDEPYPIPEYRQKPKTCGPRAKADNSK